LQASHAEAACAVAGMVRVVVVVAAAGGRWQLRRLREVSGKVVQVASDSLPAVVQVLRRRHADLVHAA